MARPKTGVRRPKAGARSSLEVARDRQRAAELYCKGWTQYQIAAELKLTQSTISRDLAAVKDQWQASMREDYGLRMGEELAKLAVIEREAWKSWAKSLEQARDVRRQISHSPGDGGDAQNIPEYTTITQKDQAGDPRFLQVVANCIERRCKLLGLDAPEKVMVGFKDLTAAGSAIGRVILTFVPPEHHKLALAEIQKLLTAARPGKGP